MNSKTLAATFMPSLAAFSSFKQRRDFLKTAGSAAVVGSIPTLDALSNVAHAAGAIDTAQVAADYKAIVCVFFYGGQDHSNILIPYQDGDAAGTSPGTTTAEYDLYAKARSNFSTSNAQGDLPNMAPGTGNLAYTRAALAATALSPTTTNSVTKPGGWTTNTHGRQFALHPKYAELKAIYDAGSLAVIANVGPLVAPVNRAQLYGPSAARPPMPVSLYSHDDQQKAWMSGNSRQINPSVGIGGRIANTPTIVSLNLNAPVATQISINGSNTFMLTDSSPAPSAIAYQLGTGSIGRLQNGGTATASCNTNSAFISANPTLPYCVSGGPITLSSGYSYNATLKGAFLSRINATSENSSVYSDQWRQTMKQSIDTQVIVSSAFINSPPTEEIVAPFNAIIGGGSSGLPYNNLAGQLRMVAAMIRASSQLGAAGGPIKRQIFFVGVGGFDTHGNEFWTNNPRNNDQNSKAMSAFWTALGNVQVSGSTTDTARNHVTLFTMSEFGRTLDSNGLGSDHGWGTHQIVMGGAVKGGFIYGQNHNVASAPAGTNAAPAFMEVDSTAGAVPRIGLPPPNSGAVRIANKLNHALSRGELLPTTASDAVIGTIATWFGVPQADLSTVFPTLGSAHPSGSDMGFMS